MSKRAGAANHASERLVIRAAVDKVGVIGDGSGVRAPTKTAASPNLERAGSDRSRSAVGAVAAEGKCAGARLCEAAGSRDHARDFSGGVVYTDSDRVIEDHTASPSERSKLFGLNCVHQKRSIRIHGDTNTVTENITSQQLQRAGVDGDVAGQGIRARKGELACIVFNQHSRAGDVATQGLVGRTVVGEGAHNGYRSSIRAASKLACATNLERASADGGRARVGAVATEGERAGSAFRQGATAAEHAGEGRVA